MTKATTEGRVEKMAIDLKNLAKLLETIQGFVPAPWAVETCGEKGDGAYMIGITYRADDTADPPTPLAGFLEDFDEGDESGDFIEYDRQELIAEVDFHNPAAAFIADLLWQAPDIARALIETSDEADHLREANADLLATMNTLATMLAPGLRTLDDFIRDMGLACDIARAAIAKATGER